MEDYPFASNEQQEQELIAQQSSEHLISEDSTVNRRTALRSMAAALFMAGTATAQERDAFTRNAGFASNAERGTENLVDLPPSLLAAEKAVQEQGLLTINHAWDPENLDEAAVRMPSVIPPQGYKLQPAVISTMAKAVRGGKVLLPCPRDIIDQLNAGCHIAIVTERGSFDGFKAEIVESTSADGAEYRNPFLILEFTQNASVVNIRALHWVLTPQYPPVSKQQVLQTLDPARRQAVWAAVTAAAQLPYNAANSTRNIAEIRRNGSGDCESKAALAYATARQAGQRCVDILEGYSYQPHAARFGGSHMINFVAGTNGAFTFDGGSPQSYTIGPLDQFIPTTIGTKQSIEGVSGFRTFDASNWGKHYRTELETASGERLSKAGLSLPGFGKHGAALMRIRPPQEVTEYANELWDFRMSSAYVEDPRVARQ